MLEKHGVTCDDCGGYHHFSKRIFSEKIDEIKEEGWIIKKLDRRYCHFCPDCKPKPFDLWYNET